MAWAWAWLALQHVTIFQTILAIPAILAILVVLAIAIIGMQLGIIVAIVGILPLRRGSLGITRLLQGFSKDSRGIL